MQIQQAKDAVARLTAKFQTNLADYKQAAYKETQVRIDFIDPFFEALGWDIANRQGLREDLREVVHEDTLAIEGRKKAPDYSFRLPNGRVERKFFLEAKKPAINLAEGVTPAYQVRRYGWSANLPVSALTDFEELAVYDCRVRPHRQDKPVVARIAYFGFEEYAGRFDEIYGLFSKEAVREGSLDQFVAEAGLKRGLTPVDAEFLKEIEGWRDLLARNIALRNPGFSIYDMNFAVQRTIDRLIFLRMAEDRKIETYGRLLDLTKRPGIYPRLVELYRRADARYNAGLFDLKPLNPLNPAEGDSLTPTMQLDDAPLKQILSGLYYPQSPYEFSVLGADILGNVYEQFLGKVIRLTPAHRAKVEEKPEVKKAGGVFYTPPYIVETIVKQTVGQLIKGKSPGQISKLRLLDPACGSGSFLIGAYQYLLDYHRQWYMAHNPEKRKKAVVWIPRARQTSKISKTSEVSAPPAGEWRLTIAEKKRILLNNIYGVDIDRQAVNVTQLNLLLKALEGETDQTLQLSLFQEQVLPQLSDNIKCGNSLIDSQFYAAGQMTLFSDEALMRRVNAFDWEAEFPQVMGAGGFDAVIGNPPWGADFTEEELAYHREKNREIIVRMIDSFMYFIYQNSGRLKNKGHFGMIIPDVLFYQVDNQKLRRFIEQNFRIESLLNLGNGVFQKVTRPSAIIIYSRNPKDESHKINVADLSGLDKQKLPSAISNSETNLSQILQSRIWDIPGFLFVTKNPQRYDVWEKVRNVPNKKLGDLVDKDGIQRGVSPDLKAAFIVDGETAKYEGLEDHKLRKVLTGGKHVKRYYIASPDLWLIYTTRYDNFKMVPNIRRFISQFRDRITCREVKTGKHPLYALHRPRNEKIFLKPTKVLGVITEDEIIVAPDKSQTFATDGLYLFGLTDDIHPNYVLAILNSKLFILVYRLLALETGRVLAQVKPTILKKLPIRTIDFTNPTEAARHEQMVNLVEQMLALHQKVAAAGNPADRKLFRRQIAAVDKMIDRLVYALYGLSEGEIGIVEGQA